MAWTTPTTRATGDIITASIWNTDVVNNLVVINNRIKGVVNSDGTIASGSGFSVSHSGTGVYAVTFSVSMAATPGVSITIYNTGTRTMPELTSVSTSGFTASFETSSATFSDVKWNFEAYVP